MTSVPYPIYNQCHPYCSTDEDGNDNKKQWNLSAVGRCRINPSKAESELYQQIVEKCTLMGNIDESTKEKESKQLRKKYMKQSVALATDLICNKCNLDPSIIDVEIYLSDKEDDIVSTNGCLGSCFLDAGATYIVVSALAIKQMDMLCRLPRERMVAHFDNPYKSALYMEDEFEINFTKPALKALSRASQYAKTISVNFSSDDDANKDSLMANADTETPSEMCNTSKNNNHFDVEDVHMLYRMLKTSNNNVEDDNKDEDPLSESSSSESSSSSCIIQDDVTLIVQIDPSSDFFSGCSTPDLKKNDVTYLCDTIQNIIAAENHKGGRTDGIIVALTDPTPTQLGMSYAACCKTDRNDGLYTTVVCTRNNEALGLVYSSKESLVAALECGRGVYYSRSRQSLWRKGDTSGHYQILHRIDVDCDGDAIRFIVTQMGGSDNVKAFCHLNTLGCWGKSKGLKHLEETLQDRLHNAPEGSYTKRLFDDDDLLRNKLVEEAQELSEAASKEDVAGELADVIYFAMVRATKAGVTYDDAIQVLDQRSKKVTRRQGDAKTERIVAGEQILSSNKK